MKIYAVEVTTFSCDIYGESYIAGYFSTQDKAEEYILKAGLLDKNYPAVQVLDIELDSEL